MIAKVIPEENNSQPENDSDDSTNEDTTTPSERNLKRKHISDSSETSNIPKKKNKKLFAPPTVEELNQLRETQNLFNSNLFRLQIDEILKEISLQHKTDQQITSWFENFKKIVNEFDDDPNEYHLADLSFLDKLKIKLPLQELPIQSRGFFKYLKTKNINLIHLYRSNCSIYRPNVPIDVNIEIPLKCFHKTDAINGRYLLKRAIYLGYLASKLNRNKKFRDIFYTYQNGNILKPLLLFKFKNLEFRLHATVESNLFKYSKFNPSKNNVQGVWFFEHDDNFESSTPFYNSCILEDLTSMENDRILYECLKDSKNIQDGLKLLQVWLRQRSLDIGFGGFTSELMAMFLVYLIKSKKLNNAMSSYQVVRNVWVHLGDSHWSAPGKGISLSNIKKENQPDLEEFHGHFPVVFVDVTGFYNLAAFLNQNIYFKIRDECKKAVKYLDDNYNINNFRHLFTEKMPFYQQFDQILKININKISKHYDQLIERHERLDYMTFKYPLWVKQLLNLLTKGLNDRITLICPKLHDDNQLWPTNELIPTTQFDQVVIGFNLNDKNAFNKIEKGPLANLPEAIEFREFWGKDKSELRRFNDGSITECIAWDTSTNSAIKRDVSVIIINYLLESKFYLKSKNVDHFCDQFTSLLTYNKMEEEGEEAISLRVTLSYDNLVKKLRNLKNLPLDIATVHGASSVFSYTDVSPGIATTKIYEKSKFDKKIKPQTFKSIQPYDVVLHLALSGKWPNNLDAIRRLKAAFYIKIAKQLETQHKDKCFVHTKYVDVIHDEWVFRLRILINKEISLLKKTIDIDGIVKYRDTDESLEIEKQLIHLPKLTSALLGLHSQYVSYGLAARLAKRWLCSQLLDASHIPEVVIDLLVASLYVTPEPYDTPKLPQIAFLRFLRKMVNTDWQTDPLIINFNEELTSTEINEMSTTFNKNRSTLSPLFIITPYDAGKSIWTRITPTQQILSRIKVLARESLNFIEKHIYEKEEILNYQALFHCSLTGYDVIIKLKAIVYNQTKCSASHSFNNSTIINTNPVQSYLNELREFYGEYALFFYNPYGGNFITVLWKPQAVEQREFKVSYVNGRKLILQDAADTPRLILNKEAILDDFTILGNGLVEIVEDMKKSSSA